jgi:DNA-binding winged helix-turn-helix (wHTH) protein
MRAFEPSWDMGECTIDRDRRLVVRQGQPVHVSPKAFELLEILIEARPRVLPKGELLQRLWPDTFVVEANLSNLVAELRAALGDSPRHPQWVRTVHGFGYGFEGGPPEAATSATSPSDRKWLVYDGGRVELCEGTHLIGRDPRSIVPIDSASVSRRHARITVSGGQALVHDLGSRNGTLVRGARIHEEVALEDGDSIRVGSVVLEFRRADFAGTTAELPPREG